MTKLVSQVALAVNQDGVIGSGDRLAFRNKNDLGNFARFTAGTALVMGYNTAKQMIAASVTPKKSRPWVVVSETSRGVGNIVDHQNMYFTNSLTGALVLAEKIAEKDDLRGLTVVGGAHVYDEFFDMVDRGTAYVSKAYMFAFKLDDIEDPVKLKRSPSQIVALLRNRMVKERFDRLETYEIGYVTKGGSNEAVFAQAEAIYLTDTYAFDVESARLLGDFRIQYLDGRNEVTVNAAEISGYQVHPDMNSVTLHTNFGSTRKEIRPKGDKAGVAQLIDVLKQAVYLYN